MCAKIWEPKNWGLKNNRAKKLWAKLAPPNFWSKSVDKSSEPKIFWFCETTRPPMILIQFVGHGDIILRWKRYWKHFGCACKQFIGRLFLHFVKFYLKNTDFWPLTSRIYSSPTNTYFLMKCGTATASFTCDMSFVFKNQRVLRPRCRDRALGSQTALQKWKMAFLQKSHADSYFWKL